MWGAYRGFFDNDIQADWMHVDHIADYDTIYAPYPIMLTSEHAKSLANWVEAGGTLISETTPSYFGDRGKVGTMQPNNGIDTIFGARENEVEFMPDIGDRIHFALGGKPVHDGGFLQSYRPTTGTIRSSFTDGRTAVVENHFGAGKSLLIGTHPGIAYFKTSSADNLAYFADIFAWTDKIRNLRLTNPLLQARVHDGPIGRVLWVLNPTRETQHATVSVPAGAVVFGAPYWTCAGARCDGADLTVPPRDAVVVRLPQRL
ncbi:MAG: beta-galactosidase trimerization domain-containing protein [Candidatus Devosia euplotis]|nr:beta-galactosidase trimerization domain-containing protein [Candidatus Devosia euplotis]